jgi:hypothetical protein
MARAVQPGAVAHVRATLERRNVASRGKALGVPTPVNQTLYTLVKLLEESTSLDKEPR